MTDPSLTVLLVGATGSVGRHVVTASLTAGHRTRALVRTPSRASDVDPRAETVVGDLTDAATLADAVEGIDAVIFTHGDNAHAEAVNYGAVRNVLRALNGRPVRIALMTTIGVTVRHPSSEWKRRGERLVRASGNRYTIVRPGWFDYNDANERKILMLQGDTRRSGSPADGAIARDQLARVLVAALTDPAAEGRTFELFDERGPEQDDLSPLFAALDTDPARSVDGVLDQANLPLEQEPAPVRADLDRVRATR
ncbi:MULTISPECIES: SDR family oxidoreductase [unclassified Rathayibacter]|uniref:SDR family oxidoreductase n=1 Tax=unclassified Rathayibacter TaxID=2609250 RepID=UPI001FB44316|nr:MULTISPECIES: SDR family oxidoreductase [unclassified Rathayibacter]MCJ1674474.1 SDR family oxidoreductase [Rathayibacter sp. VKM Ac-2929]MCJ1684755.1 SDR family oxidoreductase [Rathayibacter sp. VKM Ac-2928]